MLNVVMLSVIMLSVNMLSVIMLSVIMLSAVAPIFYFDHKKLFFLSLSSLLINKVHHHLSPKVI